MNDIKKIKNENKNEIKKQQKKARYMMKCYF